MNDNELFLLEHKKLPLLALAWKEGAEDIVRHLPEFAARLVPSFDKTLFKEDNSGEALSHIWPYMGRRDKAVALALPFKENREHVGLAKYAYIVYNGRYADMRFFLFELDMWHNGDAWLFRYYPVEYRIADNGANGYELLRKAYIKDVWWSREEENGV